MSQAERHDALVLHADDHVATAVAVLSVGQQVRIRTSDGTVTQVTVREAIRYGHKFAVTAITAGEHIRKYGESIGTATRAIERGEHVHTHNVESRRGRGDLAGEGDDDEQRRHRARL